MIARLWQQPPGWLVLVTVLLGNAVYAFMVLVSVPALMEMAGGLEPLDLRMHGYDAAAVSSLFDALGENGRAYYQTVQIPVDLIYPGAFMIYAVLLWRWLWLRRGEGALKTVPLFGIVAAIAGGLFDYAENVASLTLLSQWPGINPDLVVQTSLFTQLKFSFVSITLVMLMVYGAWIFLRRKR